MQRNKNNALMSVLAMAFGASPLSTHTLEAMPGPLFTNRMMGFVNRGSGELKASRSKELSQSLILAAQAKRERRQQRNLAVALGNPYLFLSGQPFPVSRG